MSRLMGWGALALALGLAGRAFAQPVLTPATTGSIALPTSTQARTVLIPGVADKAIYLTALYLVPQTGAVVTFTEGTGSNCATNPAVVRARRPTRRRLLSGALALVRWWC